MEAIYLFAQVFIIAFWLVFKGISIKDDYSS